MKKNIISRLRRSPYMRTFLVVLASIVVFVIGTLLQIAEIGQILIVVYGIIAIILRVRSNDTLNMALIVLLFVPIVLILKNYLLAETFAIYAFLLFVIGILSALIETHRRKA